MNYTVLASSLCVEIFFNLPRNVCQEMRFEVFYLTNSISTLNRNVLVCYEYRDIFTVLIGIKMFCAKCSVKYEILTITRLLIIALIDVFLLILLLLEYFTWPMYFTIGIIACLVLFSIYMVFNFIRYFIFFKLIYVSYLITFFVVLDIY